MDLKTNAVTREAHILKERFDVIDGKSFNNPTFETFLPHISLLNLGGVQIGTDENRNSESMIPGPSGKAEWQKAKEQAEIIMEKVQALFTKHGMGGQSKEGKQAVIAALEKHFGTTSWKEIETTYNLEQIKIGYDSLHLQLEGIGAYAVIPDTKIDEDVTQ